MRAFTECFAADGAKLPGAQWAVSAIAAGGALVLSGGSLQVSRPDRDLQRYGDRLSRRAGNEANHRALRRHRERVRVCNLPVRPVIATPVDRAVVDSGCDASTTRNTFHTKPDVAGHPVHFDGDACVIDFKRAST